MRVVASREQDELTRRLLAYAQRRDGHLVAVGQPELVDGPHDLRVDGVPQGVLALHQGGGVLAWVRLDVADNATYVILDYRGLACPMIDSSKVIETVKLGGPLAASELERLLDSGVAYPGDVSDVIAMTSDYSRFMFLTPVAAIAWGYLEARGIAQYVGDDDHVNGFVSAITSGRAYDGRYARKA